MLPDRIGNRPAALPLLQVVELQRTEFRCFATRPPARTLKAPHRASLSVGALH